MGIWALDSVKEINVPEYHLHFITEDRKAGGHIPEIHAENITVKVDIF